MGEKPFPEGMDMNWALDVQSAQTLDFLAGLKSGKVAWDLGTLTGISAAVLSQHMKVTTVEREACLVDLDKPMYAPCYKLIMENGLLAPGAMVLCDNVLYRGLTAQFHAGEMPEVSEKTAANAAAMDGFLGLVRADTAAGKVRSLMMPVRDGMLALQTPVAPSANKKL